MADALLTAGPGRPAPATGQVAQSARIEQTRPMCCFVIRLRSAPAGAGRRPGRWRPVPGHDPGPGPAAGHDRRPPESRRAGPGAGRAGDHSRWRRFGWLFAAIWLVYLARRPAPRGTEPDPVRRYLGLATLIAFAAVFSSTFARARAAAPPRQVARACCRRGRAGRPGRAGRVRLPQHRPRTHRRLLIYLAVMAVFLLPIRAGWAVVAVTAAGLAWPCPAGARLAAATGRWPSRSSSRALAAWGVVQLIQRNMQLAAGPERDHPAGPGRRAQPVRPRPARHPGPLADRGRGQGRAGRAAGQPGPGAGRGARSPTWSGSPGRRWPTSGPRRPGTARSPWPGSWPAPGPRWPPPASRPTCPTTVGEVPRRAPGAVRLGGPRGRDQRGPAQRRHPLLDPGQPGRDRDQRRRAAARASVRARRRPAARPDRLPSGHGLAGLRERAAAAGATIGVARSRAGRLRRCRVRMP